jgi:DNA-binding SARP family transcriptional activator/TolB-like protein
MTLKIGVLGPLLVEVNGQVLGLLPRKASALLAYLSAQRGAAIARERLADLLWPDQNGPEGRHSLRNCLWELRRAMGPEADRYLIADTVICRLAEANVDLDLFERLAGSADCPDLRTASDLYRGEFLADLAVRSQPFQEWLSVERQRLLAKAGEVLERLVRAEAAGGAHEMAVRYARRLVALDPLSEPSQRTLMQAYFRAGRRPEALRQYQGFVDLLKGELAVPPDAETKALANAIVRSAGALEPDEPTGWTLPAASPAKPAASPSAPSSVSAPRWPCVAARVNVGVAPLLNLTGDPAHRHLAEGFGEDLLTDLMRHCRGVSLTRPSADRGDLGRDDHPAFDYLITGSMQLGRTQTLRINLQVAAGGECRWARRFECAPVELPSVQTEITAKISHELHLSLLAQLSRDSVAKAGNGVPDPSGCLSRAAAALDGPLTPETTAAAQGWYLGALAQDAWNLEALIGVARTCQHIISAPGWGAADVTGAAFEIGAEAISAALAVAPNNPRANTVKGMLCSADGKVEEAALAFERALAADPGLAIARGFTGYNAAFLGRADQTAASIRQAMQLDSNERRDSIWFFFAGFSELLLGRTEDAIRLLSYSLERNPQYGSAQLFLATAQDACGRGADAKRTAAQFRSRYPGYRLDAFDNQWLRRAKTPAYRAQIHPLFERVRGLDVAA